MLTKIVEYQAPKDEFLENPIGKGAENEEKYPKNGFFRRSGKPEFPWLPATIGVEYPDLAAFFYFF